MAYGKRTYRPYKKTSITFAKKTYKKRTPGLSKKAVKTMIKSALAKKIETKIVSSLTVPTNEPLYEVTAVGGLEQFAIGQLNSVFTIQQGTAQDERIGNEINLKKWVLKFTITPTMGANSYITSPQLLVDFYIAYRKDGQPITLPIAGFFQNGSSSITPTGVITERLYPINRDVYHITYRKKFKVGISDEDAYYNPYAGFANNDFPMIQQFSLDLCKHGFKSKKVRYNDSALTVQDNKINALYYFFLIYNANGYPLSTSAVGVSTYDFSMVNSIAYTD